MSSLAKKNNSLDVRSPRELIDAYSADGPVTGLRKGRNIPCKTSGFTGYVKDLFHAVSQDLGKRFRVYAVPRRIENDQVRLFSPAINSQLPIPFLFAFSAAASTASSTISTPITFSETGAMSCEIVPVPQ